MPQTRDLALEELAAAGDVLPVTETRVDAAHSIGDAPAGLPPLAEMPVAQAITELVRVEGVVQLQAQADELAAHLRQRQQELDRREAQLHARLAAFEQEVRDARLWLAERNDQLNDRERKLQARETASTAGLEPATPNANLGPSPGSGWPWQADIEEQREAIARQSQQLDLRRAAIEKSREETARMHREALELRLAAEIVHEKLAAILGVVLTGEALKATRRQLAEHHRHEEARLTRQRDELQWLKRDLTEELGKLEQRYDQMRSLGFVHRP